MSEHQIQRQKPIPLDAASESILIWEETGFPQTDFLGFTLKGPVDIDKMAEAVIQAQGPRPHFHANLFPVRRGFFQVMSWHIRPKPCKLETIDCTSLTHVPEDAEGWLHEQMADETGRIKNLRKEYPVHYRLYLLPENTFCFAISFHHVAADGAAIYDACRDVFAAYEKLVTGETPSWADVPAFHSLIGKVKEVTPPDLDEFFKQFKAQRKEFPEKKIAQIISRPDGPPGRKMVRRIISDQDKLKAMRDRVRFAGGTLSDLFMAASMLALEEWNTKAGKAPDIMLHGLAVNQRLRQVADKERFQANPMSLIGFHSRKSERGNTPKEVLDFVIRMRKDNLAQGHDVAISELGLKMRRYFQWLPWALRSRIRRMLMVRPITLFVTNPGILWPEVKNGKLTGDSAINEIGGAKFTDIHLSVGGTKKNPMAMILQSFQGKLYVLYTVGLHLLSETDARAFAELVERKVKEYL